MEGMSGTTIVGNSSSVAIVPWTPAGVVDVDSNPVVSSCRPEMHPSMDSLLHVDALESKIIDIRTATRKSSRFSGGKHYFNCYALLMMLHYF